MVVSSLGKDYRINKRFRDNSIKFNRKNYGIFNKIEDYLVKDISLILQGKYSVNGKKVRKWDKRLELFSSKVKEMSGDYLKGMSSERAWKNLQQVREIYAINVENNKYLKGKHEDFAGKGLEDIIYVGNEVNEEMVCRERVKDYDFGNYCPENSVSFERVPSWILGIAQNSLGEEPKKSILGYAVNKIKTGISAFVPGQFSKNSEYRIPTLAESLELEVREFFGLKPNYFGGIIKKSGFNESRNSRFFGSRFIGSVLVNKGVEKIGTAGKGFYSVGEKAMGKIMDLRMIEKLAVSSIRNYLF